jgi:CheY-like chemotaxis protein
MKIFVLDDSPLRLAAFRRHFEREHDAQTAQTAKAAIELLSLQDFDLIFLDHDLGGKPPEYYGQDCDPSHPNTGSEVIRWMQSNPKPRNVVVHSRNSIVVVGMIEKLQTIEGTACQSIPFDKLSQAWGEFGIW